jgi:hypothetical protein
VKAAQQGTRAKHGIVRHESKVVKVARHEQAKHENNKAQKQARCNSSKV